MKVRRRKQGGHSRLRRIARVVLFVCFAIAGFAVLLKQIADKRVFGGYDPELPLAESVMDTAESPAGTSQLIAITGLEGERIPLRVMIPANTEAPYPCVVFLYGIGQDTRFFDKIAGLFAERGVMLVMPEQYNRGVRKERRGIRGAWALRERSSRIVPETRRAVDYLLQRGDVDAERLSLLGASYGGIMGCAVMNHEPRFRSAVIALAGGNLPEILRNLADQENLGAAAPFAATLGGWILSPFEPVEQVSGIAPRPVLFQHLEGDELIPKESADALFAAAGEPKTRRWLKASHVAIDEETVRRLLGESLDWIVGLDLPAPEGSRK